jgi:tetratricopeptide (TPR) repeat protein
MRSRSAIVIAIAVVAIATPSCRWRSSAIAPPTANTSEAPSSLIARADQLYSQREDLRQLEQGIVLLRQAAAAEPNNYEANWRLAKFNFYLASHTEGDYKERAFKDGANAGKTAVALQPDKPDGHFWLGANYGGALEAETITGLASIGDVRSEMETVLKQDEGYQDGSAYMVLGLLDLKSPKIVGGDPQKAVSEFEKGLQFGKGNAFLRLHLAEAYAAVGRNSDAQQQLNAILSLTPDPNYLPELKEAQAQARQLLEKINK